MRPFAQDLRRAFLIEVDHAGKAVLRRGAQLLPEIVERRRAGACAWQSRGYGRGVGARQRTLSLFEVRASRDCWRCRLSDGGNHWLQAEECYEKDDDDEGSGIDHGAGMLADRGHDAGRLDLFAVQPADELDGRDVDHIAARLAVA